MTTTNTTAQHDSDLGRLQTRTLVRRKPEGIAAALLPYNTDGSIAWDSFATHLVATQKAGLTNAVNMDTGYANYITADEKLTVLKLTRETLGVGVPFVAGAYIENKEGDDAALLYRREIGPILAHGGTPILFQSARMKTSSATETARIYRDAIVDAPAALGFELSEVFAPNGRMFDEETVRALFEIPNLVGMKHSSLDMRLEMSRLELRDSLRPDFRIYTGNDLGVRMIEYGSDYLLGLSTFTPELFAKRDELWATGDADYYNLAESLQYLGHVAFRAPVPAYKHSAATFLHLCGRIPTPNTHVRNPQRPDWEREMMASCAARLGLT